jgi:hypothetical protein
MGGWLQACGSEMAIAHTAASPLLFLYIPYFLEYEKKKPFYTQNQVINSYPCHKFIRKAYYELLDGYGAWGTLFTLPFQMCKALNNLSISLRNLTRAAAAFSKCT